MVDQEIIVKDPFCLRQILSIASEICNTYLLPEQNERISSFINSIESDVIKEQTLSLDKKIQMDLTECLLIFKRSKIRHWIREDFLIAMNELERQIKLNS